MLKTANPILNKALEGKSVSAQEALELFESAQLLDLAYVANEIRRKHHSDSEPATYVVQRNVNYTNVCTASVVSVLYTYPNQVLEHNPAYVLDYETEMKPKLQALVDLKGTEILLQGGHNPGLGIEYYVDLFTWAIKKDFPSLTLHALSPAEIQHITEKRITPTEDYGDGTNHRKIIEPSLEQIKDTLQMLKEAGMDSLPGAGAEILTEKEFARLLLLKKSLLKDGWISWK